MQQKIVEGGMDVMGSITGDLRERAKGKGHAGSLVSPQTLAVKTVETEKKSQGQNDQQSPRFRRGEGVLLGAE
jgi:hypothetical protein